MRDGLLSKRVGRETRGNARRGRRALREKLLKFVKATVLPDITIFNDFVGKTKRTSAPCVLGEKAKPEVNESEAGKLEPNQENVPPGNQTVSETQR